MDYNGIRKEARIDFVKDVRVGDYVIVHTGFAIEKIDEDEAIKSLKAWDEVLRDENE